MAERFTTAGFLITKMKEREDLRNQAKGIVPSLVGIEKHGGSIAIHYGDPTHQEQAEALIRELLLKEPGAENYVLVINSGKDNVGSDITPQSVF